MLPRSQAGRLPTYSQTHGIERFHDPDCRRGEGDAEVVTARLGGESHQRVGTNGSGRPICNRRQVINQVINLPYKILAAGILLANSLTSQPPTEVIQINTDAPARPFPHFWEQVFGSGRAVLSLRDSYRRDLSTVQSVTGIRYVRFHAILHDETGVYDEDAHGRP